MSDLFARIFEYPGNSVAGNVKLGAFVLLVFLLVGALYVATQNGLSAAQPLLRLAGYAFGFLVFFLALDVGLEKLYYWWSDR